LVPLESGRNASVTEQEAPDANVFGDKGQVFAVCTKSCPEVMDVIVNGVDWPLLSVMLLLPEVCPTETEPQDRLEGEL